MCPLRPIRPIQSFSFLSFTPFGPILSGKKHLLFAKNREAPKYNIYTVKC